MEPRPKPKTMSDALIPSESKDSWRCCSQYGSLLKPLQWLVDTIEKCNAEGNAKNGILLATVGRYWHKPNVLESVTGTESWHQRWRGPECFTAVTVTDVDGNNSACSKITSDVLTYALMDFGPIPVVDNDDKWKCSLPKSKKKLM